MFDYIYTDKKAELQQIRLRVLLQQGSGGASTVNDWNY